MRRLDLSAVNWGGVFVALCALLLVVAIGVAAYDDGMNDSLATECLLHGGEPIWSAGEQLCLDRRVFIELRPALPTPLQETQP